MRNRIIVFFFLLWSLSTSAQNGFSYEGQLSSFLSYAPKSSQPLFASLRYIPEIAYTQSIDSFQRFDFAYAANSSYYIIDDKNYGTTANFDLSHYRLWGRYSGKQFQIRVGLQKIEFGSAAVLRPLQWFNNIDPRDPLQLTTGVKGVLTKYDFLNNANLWIWGLNGNQNRPWIDQGIRLFNSPEYGGRFQYPISKGEIALSYHFKKSHLTIDQQITHVDESSENRVGIDGKWDIGVGLWVEAAHIWQDQQTITFEHQTLATIGTDYTFGIGNGLHFLVEHMMIAFDDIAFQFSNTINLTASTLSYPLGLFDNISSVLYYNWSSNEISMFLNYSHDFKNITTNLILFHNPEQQPGIQSSELFNSFAGPGVRLMFVYNH